MPTIDLNADLGEGFGAWRMGDDAALLRIVTSAKARGKFAGLYCPDGARARYARERGVGFCTVSSDQELMRSAARQELAVARS